MIPNRAMFYWSGGPLSWMRANALWSFRKLHPDWEMILFFGTTSMFLKPPPEQPTWGEERQDWQGEAIAGGRLAHDCIRDLKIEMRQWHRPVGYPEATPVHENDLCRWGALSKFGGWFFDLDFLFVDQMSRLPAGCNEADVCYIPARDWIPTGFMGAVADNEFTAAMYSAALSAPDKTRYRAAGSETIARVVGLSHDQGWYQHTAGQLRGAIQRTFPGTRFASPGLATAYRWEWYDSGKIFSGSESVLQHSVAIHWYGGSRIGQRWQRKLTEQNYSEFTQTCPYASYCFDLARAEAFA